MDMDINCEDSFSWLTPLVSASRDTGKLIHDVQVTASAKGKRRLSGSSRRFAVCNFPHQASQNSSLSLCNHLPRNATICCIWPLELGPEPQMARNGRSSPPRGRRWGRRCRSSLPWSRRMLDGRLSSLPGTAACATGAARACPEAA